MSGSKAAPTAIVQQGRARVVVVHWASGEKHRQAVVKHIPPSPACAQIPAGSHWKGNPVGCWMQQVPAMASAPQAGKCWSSQEQENIPQVVGVLF